MSTRFFTSWVRRGAAAGIIEPDATTGAYPGPATFQPSLILARDGAALAPTPGPNLTLMGPGAVAGLNPRAIVRTDPAPNAKGVEDNYLVQIELARPDLPWMFTPAKPNAAGRLSPWMVLIVVEATIELQAGSPLPRISVSDMELPDLSEAWAWAHVQVTVENPADAPAALNASYGDAAVSRLLCPRRLQPDTAYLACLTPATRVGVQSGLGLPLDPGPAIAPAWTAGAGQTVVLPVYYSWRFSTGDDGDFKSLVQRLHGVRPTDVAGFGTRTIDMSNPWQSPPQLGPGMTIELDGALGIGVDRPGTLTDAARADFEQRMTKLVNFPADHQPANSVGDPSLSAVAPPIYAGRHAAASRVPAAGWLRTLNLDPRRRIAAAFGTRYVQDHQEFLMARAWDQLGAVQEANRLRALAELASEVADRLHQRHILNLGPSEVLSITAPARTRVLAGNAGTLHASAGTTPLPPGAMTVSFSRFTRPLGPLGRRNFNRTATTIVEKTISGVLAIATPPARLDGITALASPPVAAQLPADATGRLVFRSWQSVAVTEQSLPAPPANLNDIRVALDSKVTTVKGLGLDSGPPTRINFGPPPVASPAVTLSQQLAAALLPSVHILKRLAGRVQVPDSLGGAATTRPVMACPQFTAPLAMAFLKEHQDYLLPGLGKFPDDRVTLLQGNPAFVEAFLAGANHEMNRELLWREYPTDQRGTPFRYFWPRPDRSPDILPITSWPLANALGSNGGNTGMDFENMAVLLVRGELLHRYPRTLAYAVPGSINGFTLTLDPNAVWVGPQFVLKLDARTTAFAYPLNPAILRSDIPNLYAGYYFVFSEPVTGPRFNFDAAPSGPPQIWNDLAWDSVPQIRGFAVAGVGVPQPAQENEPSSAHWGKDSADMARIAFARPFRVGYHADELLAPR